MLSAVRFLRLASAPRSTCRHSYSYSAHASSMNSNALRNLALLTALGGVTAAYFFLPDSSRSAPTYANTPISPTHFTPATLISTEECGPNTKLLTISVPPHLVSFAKNIAGFQPMWSVFIKDDDIQVERPYTPLEGIDNNGCMRFWIKCYPKGEVGRWLHSKLVGDKIEFRGPLSTWRWQDDIWNDVVMISGGTGITPFYQLFHSIIRAEEISPHTRFTLIHSSPSTKELPPSEILGPLQTFSEQHPERLRIFLHVDKIEGYHPALFAGRIGKSAIQRALGESPYQVPWWKRWFTRAYTASSPARSKIMFLVCGPDPMIGAIAGPPGRNLSQGVVGGVLGEMGYGIEQVYKML